MVNFFDRLVRSAPDPQNRAVAFLKLGVPVRGLVLPPCVRSLICADVGLVQGRLFLNGMAIDTTGTRPDQQKALRLLPGGSVSCSTRTRP